MDNEPRRVTVNTLGAYLATGNRAQRRAAIAAARIAAARNLLAGRKPSGSYSPAQLAELDRTCEECDAIERKIRF